jgi:NCAIR mutase (PurE)-related protein
MGVPGVAVDQVSVNIDGIEIKAALDRTKNGLQGFGGGVMVLMQREALDGKNSVRAMLVAETTDIDVAEFCQFTAQVIHMDTGTAVDRGRVLIGQDLDLHVFPQGTDCR